MDTFVNVTTAAPSTPADRATTLAEIKKELEHYASQHDNQLDLDGSLLEASGLQTILKLLGISKLPVKLTAELNLDDGVLTIVGTTNVLGIDTTVTMTLQYDGTTLVIKVFATLASFGLRDVFDTGLVSSKDLSPSSVPDITFKHVGLSLDSSLQALVLEVETSEQQAEIFKSAGISLTSLGFTVSVQLDNDHRSVEFSLTGSMALGKSTAQVNLLLPVSSDSEKDIWVLSITDNVSLLGGLDDLAKLVAGINLAESLPPRLDVLDNVTLPALSTSFNPVKAVLVSAKLEAKLSKSWDAVPSILVVKQTTAKLEISDLSGSKVITASVTAPLKIGDAPFTLTADKPASGPWVLRAKLDAKTKLPLSAAAKSLHLPLPHEIDLSLDTLSLTATPETESFKFTANAEWDLEVGAKPVTIDAEVTIESKLDDSGGRTFDGSSIGGDIAFGNEELLVRYDFGKDFVLTFSATNVTLDVAAIAQNFARRSVQLPFTFPKIDFKEIGLNIDITQRTLDVFGQSEHFGSAELLVGRFVKGSNNFEFAAGFEISGTFDFSNLSSDLAFLNKLDLGESGFVLASVADESFPLTHLKAPPENGVTGPLVEGVQIFAELDFSKTDLNRFLEHFHIDLEQAGIGAVIPRTISNLSIEGEIGVDIPISSAVTFTGLTLLFQPGQGKLSLNGNATVSLKHNQPLHFSAGIAVTAEAASVSATLRDKWTAPFGFRGVVAGPASMDIEIDYEGIPGAGISGALAIGSASGAFATKFDSGDPAQSVLVGSLEHIPLGELVNEVLSSVFHEPKGLAKVIEGVDLQELDLQIVPVTSSIGGITYTQGFRVKGKIDLKSLGFSASGDAEIDYDKGLTIKASTSPLSLAKGLIKIDGAGSDPGPTLNLGVQTHPAPHLHVSGKITALKVSESTYVDINDHGATVQLSGKLLNLFQASFGLSADLGNLIDSSFGVAGSFSEDFTNYLGRELSKAIEGSHGISKAIKAIESAVHKVDEAEDKVNHLESRIHHLEHELHHTHNIFKKAKLGIEIAALKVAKGTADGVLDAARDTLKATISSLGLVGKIAYYIARYGAGSLVVVQGASFSGDLENVSKGEINLGLNLSLAGHHRTLNVGFNLLSPAKDIAKIAEDLLK